MDHDGSGLLERAELCEGLANFGFDADDGPGGDVDKLMGFFDHDGGGRIDIHEFHRGLRVRCFMGTLVGAWQPHLDALGFGAKIRVKVMIS